jgi:tetratricopeptide (TPR) repeat protein
MRYRALQFVFAVALTGLGFSQAAMALGDNCTGLPGIDWDIQIGDCTAALQSGKYNNENLAILLTNRGNAYRNKEQYDRAIQDYNQAIKLNPKDSFPFNNRGNAYFNKGEYDRAIQDYTQAIKLNPTFAMAYNGRGAAYAGKGQYDSAIQSYDQAIKLKPDFELAVKNRDQAVANKSKQ